jgi:hypothetical protein
MSPPTVYAATLLSGSNALLSPTASQFYTANPPPTSGLQAGTVAIGPSIGVVTVTGLGLAGVPKQAICVIRKVAGEFNLFASVRVGTITTDGFTVDLSATTDANTYLLDYILCF